MGVVVLTDSTASLPPEMAARHGVEVIPLHVLLGRRSLAEGVDISGAQVAALLREGEESVTTSGPALGELAELYREVARRRGAEHIVSVHLSAQISRTVDSARLAAAAVTDEVEVTVVDSRTLGLAMGYAVCSAADLAASAGPDSPVEAEEVAAHVRAGTEACTAYFYVDSLEYLRRGGRIGKASAFLGSALSIKPLLAVREGEVQPWERVRTRNRALARLEAQTLADVEAHRSGGYAVRVGVHHCDCLDQAQAFATSLRAQWAQAGEGSAGGEDSDMGEGPAVVVDVVELGAVTAVHTGPGTLAVVISPVL